MRKVKVDHAPWDGEKSILQHDMARIGRTKHTAWLIKQLEKLTEFDIETEFNGWPVYGKEGQWGSIEIDVYVVMCQVLKPPPQKLRLRAPILLKTAGVGDHPTILRRLEQIEAESKNADGG